MKWTILIFLTISLKSWAYPVFFKCDEGGRLSDHITPPELKGRLLEMIGNIKSSSGDKQQKLLESYCEGSSLCMSELRQLLEMSRSLGSVSDKLIEAEVAKIQEATKVRSKELRGILEIPPGVFKAASDYDKFIENVSLVHECRVASAKVAPESMVVGEVHCIMMNFGHSPYMYPSGIRESTGPKKTGNRRGNMPPCGDIKNIALGALAMDEDPYAAIAISLMENGSNVGGLYLDPIGAVQTLGCQTSRGTSAKNNLDSYGTYYNVNYGVVSNPELQERIKTMLKLENATVPKGKTYICAGATMKNNLMDEKHLKSLNEDCVMKSSVLFCGQPRANMCCLEYPGNLDEHRSVVDKAITLSSLKKYVGRPLEANLRGTDPADYPARRLQRFNGYTDSMGGAETVSAWRSGVNFYKTPTYGYQAMDFIINTLWSNPYVKQAIEEAEEKLGRASKSVLCQDRPSGVYALEHDHYFKKHANSPRMETVKARWHENASWASLPKRHQNVLANEFVTSCPSHKEMCEMLAPYQNDLKQANTYEAAQELQKKHSALLTKVTQYYFSQVHPKRDTISKANFEDQGFNWKQMDEGQFKEFLGVYQDHFNQVLNRRKGEQRDKESREQ